MKWHTHALCGISSLWLMIPAHEAMSREELGLLIGAASLGCLLPDLDANNPKIKHLQVASIKPFFVPALVVQRMDVHRGLLHSLVGLGFIATVTVPLVMRVDGRVWLALLLGYASHLFADAATKTGIRLLYPRPKRYYLLPKSLRITTRSQAEEMLLPFLTTTTITLLLQYLPYS